jgi:DNA-binding transcriptional MerR regulator
MSTGIDEAGDENLPRATDGELVYTIGQLAQEFGVSLRTLRFYEDRGMLSPQRVGGARFYLPTDRARLNTILKGKQLGFTLSEIRAMLSEPEGGAGGLNLSLASVEQQLIALEEQKRLIEEGLAELRETRDRLLAARQGNGKVGGAD